jgi:hypothetical protein
MWDVVSKHLVAPCLEISEEVNPDYLVNHDGLAEVLWRTLVANAFNNKPATAELSLSFKDWLLIRLAQT